MASPSSSAPPDDSGADTPNSHIHTRNGHAERSGGAGTPRSGRRGPWSGAVVEPDEVPLDTAVVHSHDSDTDSAAPITFKRQSSARGNTHKVDSWLRRAQRPLPLRASHLAAERADASSQERRSASQFSRPSMYDTLGDEGMWNHARRSVRDMSTVTIPNMLPVIHTKSGETPLPLLPYMVLCLLLFGEFCSAGVSGPFLFFMIEGFGVGDESKVGFWAGIVSAYWRASA